MDPTTIEQLLACKRLQASEMLKLGFKTMNPGRIVLTNLKKIFINPEKLGQVMESIAPIPESGSSLPTALDIPIASYYLKQGPL